MTSTLEHNMTRSFPRRTEAAGGNELEDIKADPRTLNAGSCLRVPRDEGLVQMPLVTTLPNLNLTVSVVQCAGAFNSALCTTITARPRIQGLNKISWGRS